MKTRIKELRARHNLTQEQLAHKADVRRETIVFIENGKYVPSLLLAIRIASLLKSKVEDVFLFSKEEMGKN